jgi:hypothetical protein
MARVRRAAPRAALAVALVGVVGGSASCREDRVVLAFRPEPGATYEYRSDVLSSTVTALEGEPARPEHDRTTLTARQTVLDSADGIVRVEVVLERQGSGERTYVMRFDRGAQLTEVESVEGIPADALGALGLSEIFPAAAGAPPDRPLAPGDRWDVDDTVDLAELTAPTQLAGNGRLVALGVVDGRRTATVETRFTLPLRTDTLRGDQHTDVRAVYDLTDGSVRELRSVTSGEFRLSVAPPAGEPGEPLVGTLTLRIESFTTRLD